MTKSRSSNRFAPTRSTTTSELKSPHTRPRLPSGVQPGARTASAVRATRDTPSASLSPAGPAADILTGDSYQNQVISRFCVNSFSAISLKKSRFRRTFWQSPAFERTLAAPRNPGPDFADPFYGKSGLITALEIHTEKITPPN